MLNSVVPISDTAYPAAFTQMRQVNDEDGQSTISGHTFGDAAGVDSRRSSFAEPFATGDQHVDHTLPFDALTLNGATFMIPGMPNDIDVGQWISDSVTVQPKAEPHLPVADGSAATHQHGVLNDSMSGSKPACQATAPPRQGGIGRPSLVRGRSNSVPALYTSRIAGDSAHFLVPVPKDVVPSSNYEHTVLPQDWNVQIQHMTSQLNRNGSGTSSLQQVEDTIDATTQSSPQTHVSTSDGISIPTPLDASSVPLKSSRPGPAVIQNNMSLTIAKQLLTGRGSLQTLAPERTASFLDSTPSAELDGMKWNIKSASNIGGNRIESPFKMPNHLVRPGNKRLASQTLGPDIQKRQSISALEDGLTKQQSSLNPRMDRMTITAPHSALNLEQFPGRRASIPSWLPEPASSDQGPLDNAANHNSSFTPANQPMYLARSVMEPNSNVPPSFFPDLTPTLFDPMQQGFNFNPSDLNTPTYERGALALNQIT